MSLSATVRLWRRKDAPFAGNQSDAGTWCDGKASIVHADTVVNASASAWYHRNRAAWTGVVEKDIYDQHASDLSGWTNPLTNLTFGAVVVEAPGGQQREVAIAATAAYVRSESAASEFVNEILGGSLGNYRSPADLDAAEKRHNSAWAAFWARSQLAVRPSAHAKNSSLAAAADDVRRNDQIARASFAMMARGTVSAIKFHQFGIFSAIADPAKTDWRVWGPAQWFQNIRLPYYEMLASGDHEEMKFPLSLSREDATRGRGLYRRLVRQRKRPGAGHQHGRRGLLS